MSSVTTSPQRPTKPRLRWTTPAAVVAFLAITWWAGSARFGIGFSISEIVENTSRADRIISDFLSPQWSIWRQTIDPFVETLQMAIVGAVVGCAIALVVAFLASRVTAPSTAVYLADKGLLSMVRSIPDVLYALVFVSALSIGPLAGILALILFNVGVVAKLLSETIDAVDTGPLDAARAAGGSHLAAVRAAVFPQVLPNYVAYSLYTFELNLRASTVLGLVGAGGIGQLINVARSAFRYDQVAVIIVEVFVVVFVVEVISNALRRRLV